MPNKEYFQKYNQTPKRKEYMEKYWQENKERLKERNEEYNKKWCEKNKEYIKERRKQWRKENEEYYKEYWQENKEKIKEYQKKWREENRKGRNKYLKNKRQTDIKFKIDEGMATTIYHCLKGKKAGRHWETLVGYTIEDLKNHLESKFEYWMNWDNWGRVGKGKVWNIDHIKPKSLFEYETAEDEEFKKCWSLENLQPMEALENIKKGCKIIKNNNENKSIS